MSKLFDAVAALTVRDSDQAREKNDIGWNGTDTSFGHVLYEKGEANWSPKMYAIAYKMIQKYRNQLLGYGIDISDIPKPGTEQRAPKYDQPRPRVRVEWKAAQSPIESAQFVITLPLGCANFRESLADIKAELVGRRFDGVKKVWNAPDTPQNRVALGKLGMTYNWDLSAIAELTEGAEKVIEASVLASKATDAELTIPTLKATLKPFQKAGVAYALDKKKTIIGDDMGLGKTIQALATLEAANAYPAVIVCPASVKLNWKAEINRFLPHRRVCVLNGGKTADIVSAELFVLNYDILNKWKDTLLGVGLKALVADESHYLKNGQALRTKAIKGWTETTKKGARIHHKGLAEGLPWVLLLSGTATVNRAAELVSQLMILDHLKDFGGWKAFVTRYCGAYQGRFGWDLTGNEMDPALKQARSKELNQKLRALCYVRREKSDVLKELPPLQNAQVPFDITNRAEYERAEDDVIGYLAETAGNEAAANALKAEHLVRIEQLKQLAAKGKLQAAVNWIKDFVETEKLVVFATHIDIQKAILQELKDEGIEATSILGEHSAEVRQANKELFQNDPACRVIVCSLGAAREGVTLTAASNVAFVELGWTPGGMDQAAARVHRIGQEADSVTAWYLLATDTIDQDIAALIDDKRNTTKAILTGEGAGQEESILGALVDRLLAKKRAKV